MSHRTDALERKAIATAAARIALLVGGELAVETRIDGGANYLVTLCGRVYQFDSIGQVETFAGLIGGAQ